MALRYYVNAPATTLASGCSAVSTSITVASTAGLPIQYPYTLLIDRGLATEEAVSVTAAAGTDLTVSRGADGTTAFVHSVGAVVEHGITAQDVREPNQHINADNGVHGVVGDVVGTTDVQHLTNKTTDTPATSNSSLSLATTAFVKAALLAAHPVGDIKMSTTNVNPGTYLGGTWVAWGSGRVPVGVDGAQAEFNTVEETGGAKTHTLTTAEMPVHNHGVNDPSHVHGYEAGWSEFGAANWQFADGGGRTLTVPSTTMNSYGAATGISIQNAGSGSAHNNLQPYITCYMFKRTA